MSAKLTGGLVGLGACAILGRRLGPHAAARELARRQHGVVSRRQLIAVGIWPRTVDARVRARELTRLHQGVYLPGPVGGRRAEEAAAILCVHGGAWVARRSALHLLGVLDRGAKPDPVEVVALASQARRPRLIAHRASDLRADEVTTHDGIPCTTAARALIDLAAVLQIDELEYLVARAFASRMTDRRKLLVQVDRRRDRAGASALGALLEARARPLLTRSPPERKLLSLLRAAGLTPVRANVKVRGWEVDFLWERERVIVEVDAFSTHSDPRAFERDRRKDAELTRAGYTVIRVTRRQLDREPYAVVARIAAVLARVAVQLPRAA